MTQSIHPREPHKRKVQRPVYSGLSIDKKGQSWSPSGPAKGCLDGHGNPYRPTGGKHTVTDTHQEHFGPNTGFRPQLWGSWIGTMAESVHPSLMERFYQESFQLVQRYNRETAQLLVPTDPQPQSLQPQQGEIQTMRQYRQPAAENTG